MPASRPSASFVPISPDFNLPALVEATPNFEYVVRIPFEMIEQQGLENFEKLVLLHVILGGKPYIFNRFLTCKHCINLLEDGDEDAYDVCMDCYAMGRSCECISGLKWVEQFKWKELVEKYENWRHLVLNFTGRIDAGSPQPLEEERKRMTKKTLAQVCQEQLKMRPFRDPSKPHDPLSVSDDEEEQVRVLADGTAKKRKKKRSEKWMREHKNCHICKHREPTWKLVTCQCGNYYCYGSLFRAFDMMPFEIMENPEWKCPKCLKICSCGACRKDPEQRPFDPNGTLLGHDTKKVADPRSVESLVDFSRSNLKWLNDDMREHARRLKRRREQAERDKATDPTLNDEQYADDDDYEAMDAMDGILYTEVDDMPIDPLLSMDTSVSSQPPNQPAVQPAPELVQNQSSFMSEEPRDNSSGMPIATMLSDDTPPVQYPNPSLEHESSSTVIPGDGRSQLERNPELFIQRAKLAGFYGENQEMQDGGIHPSNDESVLDPSLRSIIEPSHSTTIGTFPTEQRTSPKRKQPGDRVAEGGSPSKKRRSKVANNEGPKNVTELGEPAKTASKDKPKDSPFNGRPDKAVLPAGDPPKQQHSFGMDGAADDDEFIIIKSDIVSARPKAVTNTEQAHRTKVRVERDEEFVLRKKDRHKIQKVNAKKISNGNTWIEISDDSGDGSDIAKGGTDKNNQPRKRARLSARLSRKQQHNTEMSSEATLHDSTSEPLAGPILQDSESRLPDGTPKRIQTAAVENGSTVEIDDNVVDDNIIWTQYDQHPLPKELNSTQSRTVSVASSHDTPPQGMAEKIKKDIDSGAKEIREDTTSQINGTLTGIKMTVETHHRPTRVNRADNQKVRYKGDRVGISKENLVPTKTPRQSSQANANFEAKMRALRWAEGVSSDIDTPSDTDTSSGEAHDQPVPSQLETKKPKPTIIEQRKPRGRPPKHSPKSKPAAVSNNATPVLGPSRFSKLATGKKVRIVSAKSTKKATTDVGTRFTPINAGVLE